MLIRMLKFFPSMLSSGSLSVLLFKFWALVLHEPELDRSSSDGPSEFVYAMY
jgi:hypothetical protein